MLDKELLLFPVMSTVTLAIVIFASIYPLHLSGEMREILTNLEANPSPDKNVAVFATMFVFYLITYFITLFFNVGLIGCVIIRFRGENPTISDGISLSFRNLTQILIWAVVMATVGTLLRMIESRMKGLGQFLIGLLGTGWSVATFFVVPIFIVDDVGPLEALKRSASAIRKTWGEALIGHAGLGAINMVAFIIVVPAFVLAGFLFTSAPYLALILGALAGIWLLLSALVVTTLGSILRAALYIYAVEGDVPENFDAELMESVFR